MVKKAIYEQSGIFGDEAMITSNAYNRLGKMLEMIDAIKPAPQRILDVGCGDGYLCNLLLQKYPGAEIWGIDISKTAISNGKKKYKHVHFILGDAERKMPFRSNHFDLVISGEHIEHLRDVDTYLEEINRVLVPNGHMLLTTPNLASWMNRLLLLCGLQPWWLEASYRKNIPIFTVGSFTFPINPYTPAVGHLRLYTLNILKKLLRLYGLQVTRVKGAKIMMKPVLKQIDTFFAEFPSLAFGLVVLAEKQRSLMTSGNRVKKQTVTVGIPALNAEKNIATLLEQITKQKNKYHALIKIIVYSDGSTDKTVKEARKIKDERITVISSSTRHGMAYGLKKMLSLSRSDIFVLLNDDIYIDKDTILDDVVTAFNNEEQVGLVSGNPFPIPGKTFIERAGISTYYAYNAARYSLNNGHNRFTCDGKFLALSKQFISAIAFPADDNSMGNVDAFLYYSCLANSFKYRHVKDAVVHFLFPQTLSEYIKWNTRNRMNRYILSEQFGEMIKHQERISSTVYYTSIFREFLSNPFGTIYIYFIGLYCTYRARKYFSTFTSTWDTVTTTKQTLTDYI